jgi:endonuclease/exonuclease/phosphatase family metal-dependent hydrolase
VVLVTEVKTLRNDLRFPALTGPRVLRLLVVRVMTWNLWWRFGPWEERFTAIVATIAAENPDVVCLQELWASDGSASPVGDQAELLATALGMYCSRTESPFWNGHSFSNAVLSRWPISDPITHVLPDHEAKPSHRRALLCTVTPTEGTPGFTGNEVFKVISTHFEFRFDRSTTRQAQARSIAELVAQHQDDPAANFPVIVGADTNAQPSSDEMRLLTGLSQPAVRGHIFHDCWALAGDESPGYTWSDRNPYLNNASWPRRRIDYLLVSWPRRKGIGTPTSCWLAGTSPVNGIMPSDHFGVVADLRCTPSLDL